MIFLPASDVARLVNRVGLRRFQLRLIDYLEQDFLRWEAFFRTPRAACHSSAGVIELMPAADAETYAVKYVNGHPGNPALGLSTVVGFGALADVNTGYPLLIADMTLATAFRTAATSALAARALAPAGAQVMALIGTGAQAEFQASAFAEALSIRELRIYDVDAAAMGKFVRNMAGSGLRVTLASSVADAVRGAQIVTTVTADKRHAQVLANDMIAEGVHINGVGGDCPGKTEIARDLLLRSTIVVELAEQTRVEGEIQQLPKDHEVTELWEIVAGRKPGRRFTEEITLFDSVGFAIEDFSALRLLRDLCEGTGIGERVDFLAQPKNPKDLFSLLQVNEGALRCA